jgi:hypothetical protein
MGSYDVVARVREFERKAHSILARHESSKSRVVELSETYGQLSGLSLQQDDLFRQALRCAEQGLYRASHVMAWAAFMDFLERRLAADELKKLHATYPKWAKFKSIEDLREEIAEYAITEATRKVGLCKKTEVKALQGLLNKRNECAHPSSYYPGLNDTLGYVSEILNRVQHLQSVQYP